MPTYPTPPQNVRQFAQMFGTDRACANYLFSLRYPDGYACPKCGSTKAWPVAAVLGMMQCENKHKCSLKAGTMMHRSKQGLATWFHAAWLVATLKLGISAVQFDRQLGLGNVDTAWALLHKLRAGLVAPARDLLTTVCTDPLHTDHWIEVDQVEVGGVQTRVDRDNRGSNKTTIAVAVEVHGWHGLPAGDDTQGRRQGKAGRHTRAGRCRMRVIADHTADAMIGFLQDNCAHGSMIDSDAHQSLHYIGNAGMRRHRTVVAAYSDDPLPTLGRVTTNLKRWLLDTHKGAVRPQHLQAYLNEFVFRFNRRDIPWVAFNRVLILAVLRRPAAEYDALYQHTWVHPNPATPARQLTFAELW
ncbi:MAG: IS1595 family transposase [Myxococcales bacterium]|nr:IS1595 family transposase [Myxococcales bacterium]